jgi:molybdopterin molybdotransferase
MVSFELFVRPALRKLSGHSALHRPVIAARVQHDLTRKPDGKLHLLRGRVVMDSEGNWLAVTAGSQESHQLHAMADANALVLVPDGPGVRAGEMVEAILIDGAQSWAGVP